MDEITNDSVERVEDGMSEATETTQTVETAEATENVQEAKAEENEVAATEAVETTTAEQTGEVGEAKKKKIHLPPKIQNLVDYINSHEDIRQMVLFVLFSLICGATQLVVTYALSAGLKLEKHLGSTPLVWFIFRCNTQADFIGFLVGSIVGQVLTFVLNRKKTFNVPDYVALRASMYAVMAVLIIIMQTALGNVIYDACKNAKPDANGFLDLVFNLTGQLVAGIAAMIINFLGNKFLVMRDWSKLLNKNKGEGAETAEAAETAVVAETAEAVACDVAEKTED